MPRRKAKAPAQGLGRVEDRHLLAPSAAGGSDGDEELAAEQWQLGGGFSSEEDDALRQRPTKRRRKQERGRPGGGGEAEGGARRAAVALLSAGELEWCFAQLSVSWQPAASHAALDAGTAGLELTIEFVLQPESSTIQVVCTGSEGDAGSSSGASAAGQGSIAAPGKEPAEALLALLKSGHLFCGMDGSPGASSRRNGDGSGSGGGSSGPPALHLGLSEKATAEAAGHAEEQQQRQWHRNLLQLMLGWLAPHLDPERELEERQQQAQEMGSPTAAAAAELLSSPLCSPRSTARAPAPASPFSPGAAASGAAAAAAFDASELYAAVKPTGREAELPAGATSATLLPTLRCYQARAAQWMVNRERGTAAAPGIATAEEASRMKQEGGEDQPAHAAGKQLQPLHPLWRKVPCISCDAGGKQGLQDGSGHRQQGGSGQARQGGAKEAPSGYAAEEGCGCFYLNPYNGQISLERFSAEPEVRGGILSDEMGLGKTVELLACIAAHPYTGPPPSFAHEKMKRGGAVRRSKRERIDCLCGATSEEGYAGLWLQCDECNAWMHAACLGLKRAPPGDFTCGLCQRDKAAAAVRQDCGATLVVCPTPILHQWRDEILRHIKPGALKLTIYEGQAQPGKAGSSKVVTAADLASADVVLTTYDVLRHDVHHFPDAEDEARAASRQLRRKKKYEIVPTPLTRLRWWRVCLDEAQMVESSTARAAQMALKLQTVHRWCVTGTPLSRGLEDLFGLLAFLQAGPYDNRHWWQRAVQRPYEEGSRAARARLLALLKPSLGGLLWRSAKADVAHELGLPPQHHHLTQLQMSAIEKHFFARQHQDCVAKARAALSSQMLAAAMAAAAAAEGVEIVDADVGQGVAGAGTAAGAAAAGAAAQAGFENRALTRREEASLLHPLLRLRQACCHPQVGGAGIKAVAHQRAPMTMGEVLEVMLTKARVEAEDAQRLLLASLNGLAGLLLLQGMPGEAVKAYREALAMIDQNKAHVRADKLQQLHTLHNLADLLGPAGSGVEGVAPTLRDSQLAGQAQELREEYLAESAARLAAAGGEVDEVRQHLGRAKAPLLQQVKKAVEVEELLGGWYMRAVGLFVQYGRDHHSQAAVASRIKDQLKEETMYLRSVSQNATTIASKFRDLHGLELALKGELRELARAQGAALEELQRLQGACQQPSAALVELAATCSRCRAETAVQGRVCRHCKLEELFWGWEGRAFALYSKAREGGGQVTAEDAIRQAQQATLLNRVGRGGLGEAAGLDGASTSAAAAAALGAGAGGEADEDGGAHLLLGAGRRDDVVAKTEIVRRPGDAENTLRLLLHQLRMLKVPPAVTAEKELVAAAGKVHLELLELYRRLYLKARQLSGAQRARLYALDELEQCMMRIKVLSDDELRLKEGEEIYRIYEHEVPIRSTELSNDKAAAEHELHRKLGTLRYLTGIKAREAARATAAAEAAAEAAAARDGQDCGRGRAAGAEGGASGSGVDSAAHGQSVGADAEAGAAGRRGDMSALDPAAAEEAKLAAAAAEAAPAAPSAAATPTKQPAVAAAAPGEEDKEDICPICHDRLGQELVMLACAHRLCCRCCMALQERLPAGMPQPSRRIECPECRTRTRVSELVYVDARLASPGGKGGQAGRSAGEDDIEVSGSYGTKLEAVVRRLLWLTRADATNRVLVFSTWKDLLELLSHALTANGLPHLHPRSSKKFEAAVAEFRTGHAAAVAAAGRAGPSREAGKAGGGSKQQEHPQVLLLLVKQGANGLNLTEAQHVVLCEPLLDPAVEAQAVGRVDRIGQQRSTHVHRFVVERTIEENVHRLCQQRAAAMDLSAASVKRAAGSKEQGALTVRDVALLLRQPEEDQGGEMGEGEEEGGGAPAAALSPRAAAAAAATARAARAAAAAAGALR